MQGMCTILFASFIFIFMFLFYSFTNNVFVCFTCNMFNFHTVFIWKMPNEVGKATLVLQNLELKFKNLENTNSKYFSV